MISPYTISINKHTNIIEKDKEYQEDILYLDENKMHYIIGDVYLYFDNGIKKKKYKLDVELGYAYTIGILFKDEQIYIYLHQYDAFKDDTLSYKYLGEKIILWN